MSTTETITVGYPGQFRAPGSGAMLRGAQAHWDSDYTRRG